jgi:hypothetical protein
MRGIEAIEEKKKKKNSRRDPTATITRQWSGTSQEKPNGSVIRSSRVKSLLLFLFSFYLKMDEIVSLILSPR